MKTVSRTAAQSPAAQSSAEEYDAFRTGGGNWAACRIGIETLLAAAERWRSAVGGVTRPWLCWNVDPDWCLVQQRLVSAVGWTPLVGGDPRVPKPIVLPNSVYVDFNAELKLPTMWMHFPLEFTFAFADRLAFWHSDLIVRLEKLRPLAEMFAGLPDGTMAAVEPQFSLSHLMRPRMRRYWELIGCTTKGASRSQFESGSGWWCNIASHPNCRDERERARRRKLYWDHGVGIRYWSKTYGGKVVSVSDAGLKEGHCTQIGNPNYERKSPNNYTRFLAKDLRHNFDLAEVCRRLGLEQLLLD